MAMRGGGFAFFFTVGLAVCAGAHAQGVNLFDIIARGVAVGQAKKAWDQTDQVIRNCLARQYNIDAAQLAQRGVGPFDQRVQPYINNCNRIVAAEQEQRLKVQEAEAQQRQDALAREKSQHEAAVAEKAASERRLAELTTKYGAKWAQAIANHTLLVGMSREQVLDSRGQPNVRQTVPPSDELWKYGADQVVFTGGRVSYVGR